MLLPPSLRKLLIVWLGLDIWILVSLLEKGSLKKSMRPFIVQKFSCRDLRLISCLVLAWNWFHNWILVYQDMYRRLYISFIRVLLTPLTTDQRPLTHLSTDSSTTDPPTTDPPTNRPGLTDPTDKILFKRLDNRKISILQNTNTAGKMLNCTFRPIVSFMNNMCL